MAETTLQLGFVPKERGNYTSGTNYYKDNVVQYNGSSYIADPVGWSEDDPTATYVTIAPTDASGNLNAGWRVFASGNNTFTTGEKVENVGIDSTPTSGSDNLVKSGGVYEEIRQLVQKVGNNMTLFSYDAAVLGIISLEASFDFDSAVITNYGNRDKSSDSTAVSQVIRIEFTIGQNTYAYYYTAKGENIRIGYQRLQIPAASVSQNVGDVFIGIIWQPYYNTSLNIEIYKGNVKRLLTDYSTKDNATKSVDKIFFDGEKTLGIKGISTNFDFDSASIIRYWNQQSDSVESQSMYISFVINGETVLFVYKSAINLPTKTGLETIVLNENPASDKQVSVVVDWQKLKLSTNTINYAINKQSVNICDVLQKDILKINSEITTIKNDSLSDISPNSDDWQDGSISPSNGTGSSSTRVFRINNVNYITYCIRTAIASVVPVHPLDGTIPENALNIVSNNANVYFYICAYDAENNYIGVYDVDSDTFVTSWGGTYRIASVYQRMDFSKLKTKYPTYQFAIVLSDITATSAISKDDVANYLKYEISFLQFLKDEIAESELPCNYTGEEMSVFTRGLFIGDSLTAGTFNHNEGGTMEYEVMPQFSYPKQIERFLGISVTNKGYGGKTCTTWWEEHQNDTDYDNHDFCIIQLGVNDVGKQEGGWNAQSTQSLLNIIAKVQSENSKIKVFVATIIPSSKYKGINSQTGGSYDAASQAIRDAVAGLADTNVILVDIARYGHTGETYYSNGHLNALGYQRLAKDYIAYISWIIKNNPEQFTQTAFIGTNMSYNIVG